MHDRYNRGGDYIIGSATPIPLRQLLERRGNLTELGQSIVKLQLSLHAEALSQAEARTTSAQASLTEQTASTILESLTGSEEDLAAISALPTALVRKMLSGSEVWASLPYFVFRKLRLLDTSRGDGKPGPVGPGLEQDIDQWILANERTLRDDKRDDWRRGIIDYASHANIVFDTSPESSASALVIHRGVLSGYTILDERRASTLSIQPSFLSFQAMFAKITNGLLNGLDWSNVFIAGGIVLSALLCTTDADIEKYSSSDIDIYIHGLDPVAANKKVENIFEIWKSNLPESCREKTLVVRNSRTITFFSEYPVKRVQIVLKLVQNPKEVLLNFDLDVCAMGYDGESLVMLPRAARALETGYSVFTMDLVQGHYLGDRRASQESRVFKYADKGYGIRFLPSYVDSLAQSFALPSGTNPERPRNYSKSGPSLPALEHIAFRAAEWTQKAIEKYGHSAQWTHAMLEDRAIVTSEPGERSCLTRFELLMRHVELWREHVNGNIMLSDEVWASNNYDVGPTGYDDSPVYTWGKGFNLEGLKRALEEYNEKDARNFRATYSEMPTDHSGDSDPKPLEETGQTRRVCYAPDASSLLQPQGDVVLLFFASPGFADFANGLVKEALREHSLPVPENEEIIEVLGSWDLEDREKELEALRWRINSILGWQQIDRRIDEVSEILWSFYRSYGEARLQMDDTQRKFLTEVARRAIRPSPTDEYEAFGVWVMRGAPRIGYSYGGEGQGFFGWTSDEDDDDIDEWDSAIDDESRWFDEFS